MFVQPKTKFDITAVKVHKFDVFNAEDEKSNACDGNSIVYNFSYKKGKLTSGYGIRELQMPTSVSDLETESVIPVEGEQVRALWSFTWYEQGGDELKYYLFYFNDEHKFCFDNIFFQRPMTMTLASQFTSTPVGINYRINGQDYMIFSSADANTFVFGDGIQQYLEDGPKLVSLCSHNDRLFAITGRARHTLVYSDNLNVLEWDDSKTTHLDFGDDRGNLTKVISLNDYLYVFREFGITKISTYSTSSDLGVSHIFQSSSYIYPGSIASDGENIYFMTRDGFYKFNGSSVKRIDLGIFSQFEDNVSCNAICFESKYFLACRMKFDDEPIGCEIGDYINNAIFIYDIASEQVELMRGVDVKQLLALNNPYKCKVVMCFNNANIGKIGELTKNGQVFGVASHKAWFSNTTDFGLGFKVKKVESFTIKTSTPCIVTIYADDQSISKYTIKPSSRIQRIKSGAIGRNFKFSITTDGGVEEISDFKVSVR